MAQPVRLQYHQLTFDLLGEKPAVSEDALEKIRAWERRRGLQLPASVVEWYSLELPPLLAADDVDTWVASSLEELLEDLKRQFKGRHQGKAKRVYLGWMWGGEIDVEVRLTDAADPVVGTGASESDLPLEEGPFSTFVFHQAWRRFFAADSVTRGFRVGASEPRFGPMELDYLIDHFTEGPRKVSFQGRSEMRNPFTGEMMKVYPYEFHFFSRTARVWVSCRGDAARQEVETSWEIQADSRKALREVLRQVWPVGTLSQTLTGRTRGGRAVLKQLQG
jgi:hypothetical protein